MLNSFWEVVKMQKWYVLRENAPINESFGRTNLYLARLLHSLVMVFGPSIGQKTLSIVRKAKTSIDKKNKVYFIQNG